MNAGAKTGSSGLSTLQVERNDKYKGLVVALSALCRQKITDWVTPSIEDQDASATSCVSSRMPSWRVLPAEFGGEEYKRLLRSLWLAQMWMGGRSAI